MNLFTQLDETDKEQAERYSDLLQQERYWHEQAIEATRSGTWRRFAVCRNRARYLYQIRVEHVIF